MDTAWYQDTRPPFDIAASPPAQVTLLTTDKALYTPSEFMAFGSGYWWVGKQIQMLITGKMTTGATPGNGTWDIYWGNGTDANGTILASSAAVALAASQTSLTWFLNLIIECGVRGTSGKLMVTGAAWMNALLTSNVPVPIPVNLPALSGVIDLTAANIISAQFKRSGSTAETMQVVRMSTHPLN